MVMTSSLGFVIEELVGILRKHFDRAGEAGNNITFLSSQSPDVSNMKTPVIAIYDVGFTSEHAGLGAGFGESKEEKSDQFSGNGKQITFNLSDKAVKLILDAIIKQQSSENNKTGNIKVNEYDDFKVDYKEGKVTFRHPPQKGINNISIRYLVGRATRETRALRLKIKYFFDVWSDDLVQCNMMTEEIMKALLDKEDHLAAMGINISSPEAVNLLNNGNTNESYDKTGNNSASKKKTNFQPPFGRRLIYIAETNLKTEREVPTIKKVEIKEKGEDEDQD
jgi:hypothetical protein